MVGQDGWVREVPLRGGFVNTVVLLGETVRRPLPANAEFVHRLLGLLEEEGWGGAPRFLGLDEQGREVLSFVPGHAAWESVQPVSVESDASLVRVAELVRQFHELTAGTALAGSQEVVCHNDLSPKNTIYRDGGQGLRPVAFIDWDKARPGRRIHDVARVCWEYPRLGVMTVEVGEAVRRIRLVCDAYGLASRDGIVEAILWWQERCWRGIESAAAAGDPAMVRLRADPAFADVRAAHRWVAEHRWELESDLVR